MTVLGSNPRARVNPLRPESFGVCDLCGVLRNLIDLARQDEWRGNNLVWTGYLVCYDTCLDKPFELNRPAVLPPDPEPVLNARPPQWTKQEVGPHDNDPDPLQQFITADKP